MASHCSTLTSHFRMISWSLSSCPTTSDVIGENASARSSGKGKHWMTVEVAESTTTKYSMSVRWYTTLGDRSATDSLKYLRGTRQAQHTSYLVTDCSPSLKPRQKKTWLWCTRGNHEPMNVATTDDYDNLFMKHRRDR